MGPASTKVTPLKMATLSHALPFPSCPEEESAHVLVLDTNSQHPHKCTHPFTMSLQRKTICTWSCPRTPRMHRGKLPEGPVSNTRLSTASGLCVCDGGVGSGQRPITSYSPPVPVAALTYHATVQGKSSGSTSRAVLKASQAPCSAETRLATGRETGLWEERAES